MQHIAGETRLIDYHQDAQRPFGHYMHLLQQRGYIYSTIWLPHDAQAKSLGTGRSIEEMARGAGWRVRIVPRLTIADGINAVRTIFSTMWFDQSKCADGIQALRYYRYDVDQDTGQFSRYPAHDHASHGADALRYVAVAMQGGRQVKYLEAPPKVPKFLEVPSRRTTGLGWMRT